MNYDHYVYPGTNILKNKRGITDKATAYEFERNVSLTRVGELRSLGITGRFDARHLRDIHAFLFQDVYDWAGEFRDIEIFKGLTEFVAPDGIQPELDGLFDDIRDGNYFRGLTARDAADGMADAMCRLNLIHPFREGNGRTQRVFMEQLAANAGYDLDFSRVTENDMRDASFAASVRDDTRLMRYLFRSNMTATGVPGPVELVSTRAVSGPDARADAPERVPAARSMLDRFRGMLRKPVDVTSHGRDTSDLDEAYGDIAASDVEPDCGDRSL